MMVERPTFPKNIGQLMEDMDQAADQLTKMTEGEAKSYSRQAVNKLISTLNHFNTHIGGDFWSEKKLVAEEMDATIERALNALLMFQGRPEKAAQKNVDQAIVSLFSDLNSQLSKFKQNLRNLKKHRIGHKVVKTSASKQS